MTPGEEEMAKIHLECGKIIGIKNEALRLLQDLADIQNGPPLEQHRKEWESIMEEVYGFLNNNE